MKAIKDNKIYTVDEVTKKDYLAAGYDIINDEGVIIERNPSATVPYSEYARLLDENGKLRAELDKAREKTSGK